MKKLWDKLFGPKGTSEKLLIDGAGDGVAISVEEAKRLETQHAEEVAKVQPLQKRLAEETALLRDVLDFKMTKSIRKQVTALLLKGEDPALLAAWLRAPFREVAIVANDVLAARHKKFKGKGPAPRIPTDLAEYVALAKAMEKAAKKK